MERSEYELLEIGDHVFLFKLEISYHSHINRGIAAELKKTGKTEFEVVKVISGKLLKVGDKIEIGDIWNSTYLPANLLKDVEEGVEWWNSMLRNAEDHLTSEYEKKRKAIQKRLIKI